MAVSDVEAAATRPKRVRKFDRPRPPHDWRWWVGGVGKTLIATGLLLFGFVAYQLWGTGIETARAQNSLENEFEELLAGTPPTTAAPVATTPADTTPTDTTPARSQTSTALSPSRNSIRRRKYMKRGARARAPPPRPAAGRGRAPPWTFCTAPCAASCERSRRIVSAETAKRRLSASTEAAPPASR